MKRIITSLAIAAMALTTGLQAQTNSVTTRTGSFEKNLVVEILTAEWCGYCPLGKAMINQAIKKLDPQYQSRVFLSCLHYDDDLTAQWPAVQTFTNEVLTNFNIQGFPAALVSRQETKQDEDVIGSVDEFKERLVKAFGDGTSPVEVKLLALIPTKGTNYVASVSGQVDASLAGKPLFITVHVQKNNMKPIGTQEGAPENYLHQHTMLMNLTESAVGDPLEISNDGSFEWRKEFKLDGFEADDVELLAFVHNKLEKLPNDNAIYNAARTSLTGNPDSMTELSGQLPIKVLSEKGTVKLEGEYDAFAIYDLNGRIVNNANLPAGTYVVRVVQGRTIQFIKVLIP